MNYLYSAAEELAEAAANLLIELKAAADPPTAKQLEDIRDEIYRAQQRLNQIQGDTDI